MEAVLSTHTISHLVRPVVTASLALALSPALATPALAQALDGTQAYGATQVTVTMQTPGATQAATETTTTTGATDTQEKSVGAYVERLEEERAEAAEREAAQAAEQAKQDYIDEWAPRIDAYLEGSPLAGYGATFAEAAYAYGVDPRWSPAISCIESSKGAVCFRSHNAWGWGNASWGSWEEAIWAHVEGLAEGYGSTISLDAAAKYCPPSYQSWYANVSSEMDRI